MAAAALPPSVALLPGVAPDEPRTSPAPAAPAALAALAVAAPGLAPAPAEPAVPGSRASVSPVRCLLTPLHPGAAAEAATPLTGPIPLSAPTSLPESDVILLRRVAAGELSEAHLSVRVSPLTLEQAAMTTMFVLLPHMQLVSLKFKAGAAFISKEKKTELMPLATWAACVCSCHGQPRPGLAPSTKQHRGTGCGFEIRFNAVHRGNPYESPLQVRVVRHSKAALHNHPPHCEADVLAQWQSQEAAVKAMAAAVEQSFVNTTLTLIKCDRYMGESTIGSAVRRIMHEHVSYVPPLWVDRIVAAVVRKYREEHGVVHGAHDAMAALVAHMRDKYKDRFWLKQGELGEVVALVWVPFSADAMRQAAGQLKGYVQVDDTHGMPDRYMLFSFITTDANKSLQPLLYGFIANHTKEVIAFPMRCFREFYLSGEQSVLFRSLTSDECPSINAAYEEELATKIANHFLCHKHKEWNLNARNGAASTAAAARTGGEAMDVENDGAASNVMAEEPDGESDGEVPSPPPLAPPASGSGATALTQAPTAAAHRRNFSTAMTVVFRDSNDIVQAERALEAVCRVYPALVKYVQLHIQPKLVKLLYASRIFMGSEKRLASTLTESLHSRIKLKIVASTPIQLIPGHLEEIITELNARVAQESERKFSMQLDKYGSQRLKDQYGAEFVTSLAHVAPLPRYEMLDAMAQAQLDGKTVRVLSGREYHARCAALPCDPDAVARVILGGDEANERAGYTPRHHALDVFACGSQSCKAVLEVEMNNRKTYYVAVDEHGGLACSCGGVVDDLTPCAHVFVACLKGYVQVAVVAHCAPSVWSMAGRNALSSERVGAVSGPPVCGRHPERLVAPLAPVTRYDSISNLLDALDATWRDGAVRRVAVQSAAESAGDASDAPVLSAGESRALSSREAEVALAARHELAKREAIDAIRNSNCDDDTITALVEARDAILRSTSNARHGGASFVLGQVQSNGAGTQPNRRQARKANEGAARGKARGKAKAGGTRASAAASGGNAKRARVA